MTIKFGNFSKFFVSNFVVIWEAPKIRGFSANRYARIDLRESRRFALRIAGPSKD